MKNVLWHIFSPCQFLCSLRSSVPSGPVTWGRGWGQRRGLTGRGGRQAGVGWPTRVTMVSWSVMVSQLHYQLICTSSLSVFVCDFPDVCTALNLWPEDKTKVIRFRSDLEVKQSFQSWINLNNITWTHTKYILWSEWNMRPWGMLTLFIARTASPLTLSTLSQKKEIQWGFVVQIWYQRRKRWVLAGLIVKWMKLIVKKGLGLSFQLFIMELLL